MSGSLPPDCPGVCPTDCPRTRLRESLGCLTLDELITSLVALALPLDQLACDRRWPTPPTRQHVVVPTTFFRGAHDASNIGGDFPNYVYLFGDEEFCVVFVCSTDNGIEEIAVLQLNEKRFHRETS